MSEGTFSHGAAHISLCHTLFKAHQNVRKCDVGYVRSNFSSFPQSFSNISNFRSQITYSFVKCGCSINFFPQFCKSDMSRYGYLEVSQSALDFKITRVNCTL